jgi:hypothetical protein
VSEKIHGDHSKERRTDELELLEARRRKNEWQDKNKTTTTTK